jgi:NAD(P)-dependent dehydrogenase (short-subunit alcohol dehydrogenase family)
VYIVCSDMEEEQLVQAESRADVRPLLLDVADTFRTQEVMEKFKDLLVRPHDKSAGASPDHLDFRGLVLVPDLIYPNGPIETVFPELWSDALNAKVLNTIAVTQAFLPSICEFKARVLMLTPSIVSALRPPFHSVETAVVSALEGFTASLRGELGTLGIEVCQFKLGTFDYTRVGGKQHLQSVAGPDTLVWPATSRKLFAANYVNQSRVAGSRGVFNQLGSTGSPMRELHNAVFDALLQKSPRAVWRVGRGSVTYDLVGKWVPAGIVGWMMGVRRVSTDVATESRVEDSIQSWEQVESSV